MNVIGVHFVCPRELHVTRLPDGTVETGNWLVAGKHLPTVRYVALREARKNLSYLQGDVIGHREATVAGRAIFRIRETVQPSLRPRKAGPVSARTRTTAQRQLLLPGKCN